MQGPSLHQGRRQMERSAREVESYRREELGQMPETSFRDPDPRQRVPVDVQPCSGDYK